MADEEKTVDTTVEETKETKTECPKCEECSCAGWKAGFGIFVALSVIMTIVAIVFLIKGNKIKDKIAEKAVNVADKIQTKAVEYKSARDFKRDAIRAQQELKQAQLKAETAESEAQFATEDAETMTTTPVGAQPAETPVEEQNGGGIFDSLKELSQKLFSHTEEQH